MDYNPERVECFCPECFRSSIFGFREVTRIQREQHTQRAVNSAREGISHNVSALIATFEGEQPSLSEASDNMDIDEMDIGDDVSNEPSTSRSLAIHDIDAPSSSPAAASRRLSFSDEDNVFGVEEDRDSVGGTERLLDAEDVEWDVEADNVNEEETASIDEQDAAYLHPQTPLLPGYSHPYVLVLVFLVLFQLHFLSERTSSTLIEFCAILLEDLPFPSSDRLPLSLATLRRITGIATQIDSLRRYVSCPTCHSIYLLTPDCPRTCTNNDIRYSRLCGRALFRSVGNRLSPIKEFAYQPLSASIERLFKRPGFETMIETWRDRRRVANTFYDVYDGDMWREFADRAGRRFAAEVRSLLLTLNVDWFGPFTNSTYSCGALYLTVNNLPRSERYKTENVILIGVMPGPREPSTSDMNHYLHPMVDDLLEWYDWKTVGTNEHPEGAQVRLALLLNACDIPAARKTGGFTSHASTCACHKCARQFFVFPGTTDIDYSGFEMEEWELRTRESNRHDAEQWRQADTLAARREIERDTGTRWSELHRLEYFDPVCCTIIDPMHNLFLGTAKRMTKTWIENGDLTRQDLREMQVLADSIVLPPDYVSLKRKIEAGFSFMTADDWKSWCIVYSPFVLQNHLPRHLLHHWLQFVNACRLLVKPSITMDEIEEASTLLLSFCRGVERLYGAEEVTPNMHLHMHLDVTIEDFGPLYAFWLFSFERYNGYLKEIDTNQKDSFEMTFMKKFLQKTGARDFVRSFEARFDDRPSHFDFLNRFLDIVQPIQQSVDIAHSTFDPHDFFALSTSTELATGSEPLPPDAYPLDTAPTSFMIEPVYEYLLAFYRSVYGAELDHYREAQAGRVFVNNRYEKIKTIRIMGQLYRSKEARSRRGAHAQVLYQAEDRGEPIAWPCEIQYFFRHELMVNGQLETWRSHFRAEDMDCIVPVHRLYGQVAVVKYDQTHASGRTVVIPLPKKMLA